MVSFGNISKAPARSQDNHSVSTRTLQTEHARATHKANKKSKAPLIKAASTKEVLGLLKLEDDSETNFSFPVTGSFPTPHGYIWDAGISPF